jgi:hypothetical protein
MKLNILKSFFVFVLSIVFRNLDERVGVGREVVNGRAANGSVRVTWRGIPNLENILEITF